MSEMSDAPVSPLQASNRLKRSFVHATQKWQQPGWLRIDHAGLDGHYLHSEAFVELVRSGYVRTRGATTRDLQALNQATLAEGRAIVEAIQHSFY